MPFKKGNATDFSDKRDKLELFANFAVDNQIVDPKDHELREMWRTIIGGNKCMLKEHIRKISYLFTTAKQLLINYANIDADDITPDLIAKAIKLKTTLYEKTIFTNGTLIKFTENKVNASLENIQYHPYVASIIT